MSFGELFDSFSGVYSEEDSHPDCAGHFRGSFSIRQKEPYTTDMRMALYGYPKLMQEF